MPSRRLCPSAALVAALLASLISASVATALASAASAHVRSAPLPSSRLRQVLVVADDADGLESTHGGLLRALRAAGGKLKLASTRSAAAGLRGKGGRYLYDAVVLLAPSADALSSALDADAVAAFVDAGGDALLTIEPSSGRALRELAYELGVDCGAPGAALRDHVNYNAAAEGKQVAGEEELELEILSDEVMREAWVVGEGVARESLWAPVACRGCVPLYVDERSELGARVLLAPPSAYAAAPAPSRGARAPASEPARHALVAMLQARNGARAVVAGGAHMLSDTAFEAAVALPGGGASHAKSGNEQLAAELIAWLMHARGHLRASPLRHSRPGESASPDAYRVGEEMEVSLEVEEWDGAQQRWAPYAGTDVQVELVRMHPHVRTTLDRAANGTFSAQLAIPELHGAYTLRVNYARLGRTVVEVEERVVVRPLRHDEHEGFFADAWPYYLYISAAGALFGGALLGTAVRAQ